MNMLSAKRIRYDYGGYICRSCLNREYGVHLIPRDCQYQLDHRCAQCKGFKNLVVGFKSAGHLKMLFKS